MSHVETLMPGTELAGDFRIEQVLEMGGFGVTYLAREIALDRHVAIKEYFPADFAARRDQRTAVARSADCTPDYEWGLERFIDEAQVLARFDHPNIVRVYRYFRANNTAYIVLKYEEGRSFKRWLQELGRAPRQRELDRLVEPLLEALNVVHAADLLHRDIAPDNIIVRNDGSPVLIDFGAARGDLAQFTRTVSALVKPGYSPYEQYAEIGKQQGPWTDIYALAATLYHAVTGKRPPDAPSRVVRDELVAAREAAVSAYRPRFLKAIDRGLRLDIEKRPQSIAAWRGDLLAPEEKAQRRWFATSLGRRDGHGETADLDGGDIAKTVILSDGDGAAHGVMPPPDVPGRRGRIIDFLDGARSTPQETAKIETGALSGTVAVRPEAMVAGESDNGGAGENRRGGLFTRLAFVRDSGAGEQDRAKNDKLIQGSSAGKPDGGHAALQKEDDAARAEPAEAMEPVRLRSQRRRPLFQKFKSGRISWVAVGARLVAGVGVATLIVNSQMVLSQWQAAEAQRLAQGRLPPLPNQAPLVTGSFERDAATATETMLGDAASGVAGGAQKTLLVRTFEAHVGGVSHVAFARDGALLVTSGRDGKLRVWDGTTFSEKRTIDLPEGPAFSLAVRGAQALVGQDNGRVGLWNLNLGMRLKAFKRNDAAVTALAFAGDNRFLAGASDWTVSLWDMGQPSVALHTFEGHERDVLAVAFQERAGLIASGSADRTVRLWEAKNLSLVTRYPKQRDFVTAIAFSPDGEAMLVGTLEGEISLYATGSRRRLLRYRGHEGRVTALRFAGAGRYFVSASEDGTIRFWDRDQRGERQTFGASGAGVRAVALDPGGRTIVSGKADGTVQVWRAAGVE